MIRLKLIQARRKGHTIIHKGGALQAAAARATRGSESPSVEVRATATSSLWSSLRGAGQDSRRVGACDEPAGVIGYQEKEGKQTRCVSGVERRSTGRQEERTK